MFINKNNYEKAKKIADEKYKKSSAYKSVFMVKTYKNLGGVYVGKKDEKIGLNRWFDEECKDVRNDEYPVYRPTKIITADTPFTIDEVDKTNLKKQIKIKQKIKGNNNLKPFKAKGGKMKTMKQLLNSFEIDDTLYKKNFKPKDFNKIFYEIPHEDNYNLMCDLLFLPKTPTSFNYLLVVTDIYNSKFDIEAIKNKESQTVLNALLKIFKRDF